MRGILLARLLWFVAVAVGALPLVKAQSIFINCGGNSYTDPDGITWEADKYFNTGETGSTPAAISATNKQTLYKSERYDLASGSNLQYNIPVTNGQYTLRLHFAETYSGTMSVGARVFDVKVEGSTKFNDLDIYAQAGAGDRALIKSTSVTVSDGFLTIEFVHVKQNPTISGIEIQPSGGGTSGTAVRINVGGGAYTDSQGNTWVPDTPFVNVGNQYTTPNSISGTQDPTLFKTERWDASASPTMKFAIGVPIGTYLVSLYFAEVYSQTMAVGARVFDVKMEGSTVFDDFDIFKEAGAGDRAVIKSTTVSVTDGTLTIEFVHVKQNPKICAISVVSTGGSTPPPPPSSGSIYINAGGGTYTDTSGRTWLEDGPFVNTGSTYLSPSTITGTPDQTIYKTERYDPPSGPEMMYSINVPNGQYVVALHFAEVYGNTQGINKRVFDVKMEGSTVFNDVDIYKEVGSVPNKAYVKSTTVTVSGGVLTIEFIHQIENPKICGIEIHPSGGSNPPPPPPPPPPPSSGSIYINAGGDTYTDSSGRNWVADGPFVNTGEKYLSPSTITGTPDGTIYKTERYDLPSGPEMIYSINVPNGQYVVALHFAEVYGNTQGINKRVFDVKIEGSTVFNDVDIYKEVGSVPNKAYVKSTSVTVSGGVLTIEFIHQIENPKICAIEIHPSGGSNPPPPPPPPPSSGSSVFINAGGNAFTDPSGNQWQSDSSFVNTGNKGSTGAAISGTLIDALYQSERWDSSASPALTYNIPLPNGNYELFLHFAETYGGITQAGQRVFDVSVEGSVVLSNMDIFAEAGNQRDKAVVKKVDVSVSGGSMQIVFLHKKQNPTINGIEIHPKSSASNSVIAINCGSGSYTDSTGKLWVSDAGYYSTGVAGTTSAQISNTNKQKLYQSERYDLAGGSEMKYNIPLTNGQYSVQLHFCETYSAVDQPGKRVFNVKVEGVTVLNNLDVYAETGGRNKALIKTANDISVSDGSLTIEFLHGPKQNPMINAIEVLSSVGGAPPPPPPPPPPPVPAFQSIYINAGASSPTQGSGGITWAKDEYFNTGTVYTKNSASISGAGNSQAGTKDAFLYKSERFDDVLVDPDMIYEIPLPDGVFEVRLHFAEIFPGNFAIGARVFDVLIEGNEVFPGLDIYKEAGANTALTKITSTPVKDGFLTIEFRAVVENAKLSALEVHAIGEISAHYAHAVPGGPYYKTNVQNQPSVPVQMDGVFSHTHAAGAVLTSWIWKKSGTNQIIGTGETPVISFGVGVHDVTLTVTDSTGDVASDVTTVTIRPFGYPDIVSLSPDSGEFASGQEVIISGSGFNSNAYVLFGGNQLSGSDIEVINQNTIKVKVAPLGTTSGSVPVSVVTNLGESNSVEYTYFDGVPVSFTIGTIESGIFGPTCLAFGPDGRLYVATQGGDIIRYELDDNMNIIKQDTSSIVSSSEPPYRTILGIAFDPTETNINAPTIYVATNFLFHGQIGAAAYNGKINAVSGPNMDQITTIISGLPVSDHDHGINGIEFGDHGELYIQIGGNTNAGVPGELSSTGLQDEDAFSAATLVADVKKPGFNGNIQYNPSTLEVLSGSDVRVFASGQRNPFDIVLHSNGLLYGTDNGPNNNFGDESTGCNTQDIDPVDKDELNLIEDGNYYGHPNRMRGASDPRQCVYRHFDDLQNNTPAIKKLPSSTNGICEFQTEHFGGQLRGQLIIGRYKGALYNVKLSSDGRSALFRETYPPKLTSNAYGGLDVTQGPDGSLFVAKNDEGSVIYHKPNEAVAPLLKVLSVFPRRGHLDGGTTLTIYGQKFSSNTGDLSVTVGGLGCPIISASTEKIKCTLPAGLGKADVMVTNSQSLQSDTLMEGYRYITGMF